MLYILAMPTNKCLHPLGKGCHLYTHTSKYSPGSVVFSGSAEVNQRYQSLGYWSNELAMPMKLASLQINAYYKGFHGGLIMANTQIITREIRGQKRCTFLLFLFHKNELTCLVPWYYPMLHHPATCRGCPSVLPYPAPDQWDKTYMVPTICPNSIPLSIKLPVPLLPISLKISPYSIPLLPIPLHLSPPHHFTSSPCHIPLLL